MIQSLIRAMGILEALKKEDRPFSLAEIAQDVQLPPSTVHRILQTFCSKSYVIWDERTHLYKLGPALIVLGLNASAQISLRDNALPFLRHLTETTTEDSYLVIRNGNNGLLIEKEQGSNQLKIVENYGYELELHCGGIRKSLLAFQPCDFIEQYCSHSLKHYSKGTITDSQKLHEELQQIRDAGIAVTSAEYVDHATGIGCPIFDSRGTAVASVGVVIPQLRACGQNLELVKEAVKNCARGISESLGYHRRK